MKPSYRWKDVFVEVDWMRGHRMKDAAKWKVGTRFLNNPTGENIWLHIDARFTPMNQRFICILGNRFPADDGKMGGGEQLTHHENFYTDSITKPDIGMIRGQRHPKTHEWVGEIDWNQDGIAVPWTEDIDKDGNFDTGEDDDHDGVLDADEDIDGDGVLDLNEDLDGDKHFDDEDEDAKHDNDGNFDFKDSSGDYVYVSQDTNGNGYLDINDDTQEQPNGEMVRENDGLADDGDGHLDEGIEDIDDDGRFDTGEVVYARGEQIGWTDIDDDGVIDYNEDLDNDGIFIKTVEDKNGNGVLDGPHMEESRKGKFHYCVFGHDTYGSDGELHLGLGWGANMTVSDEYMDTQHTKHEILQSVIGITHPLLGAIIDDVFVSDNKVIRQAGVFMHELGHALDLSHPEPPFKETHDLIPGISKLPTGYGPLDEYTCMNYWYILGKVKYSPADWDNIDLTEEISY